MLENREGATLEVLFMNFFVISGKMDLVIYQKIYDLRSVKELEKSENFSNNFVA